MDGDDRRLGGGMFNHEGDGMWVHDSTRSSRENRTQMPPPRNYGRLVAVVTLLALAITAIVLMIIFLAPAAPAAAVGGGALASLAGTGLGGVSVLTGTSLGAVAGGTAATVGCGCGGAAAGGSAVLIVSLVFGCLTIVAMVILIVARLRSVCG